jgi:hypothetical protein
VYDTHADLESMMANDRLTAAVHYLIAKIPPSALGATKLNKVLWFADCAFYRRHGRSITGVTHYTRKPNGPYVEGFERVLTSLKDRGTISEEQVLTYSGYPRREFTSHVPPDISQFSGEEIDALMEVAKEIVSLWATEASDKSHDALWEQTPGNGRMSVAAGAVRVQPVSEDDAAWAREAFA